MNFKKWIHHLFNPHCVECKHDENEKYARARCQNCDELKEIIVGLRLENSKLIGAIVDLTKPPVIVKEESKVEEFKPIQSRMNSRSAFIRNLEKEDAAKAAELTKKSLDEHIGLRTDIEEAEKVLGIING